MTPRYTILIPAWKGEFLTRAVATALAQDTPSPYEVVVVDDASPYRLEALLEPYLADPRLRYVRNAVNIGGADLAGAWRKALEYARGEWVMCMGDDDELDPGLLSAYDSLIARHPELDLMHARTILIDARGEMTETTTEAPEVETVYELMHAALVERRRHFLGDYLYRTSLLRRMGGYVSLPQGWGSDECTAYLAALTGGGVAHTRQPLYRFRRSEDGMSSNFTAAATLRAVRLREEFVTGRILAALPADEQQRLLALEVKHTSQRRTRLVRRYVAMQMLRSQGYRRYLARMLSPHGLHADISFGTALRALIHVIRRG